VEMTAEFDEDRAERMADDHEVRVLITNLPRPRDGAVTGCFRDGAAADDVLRIYLGEYHAEGSFRLMKTDMYLDKVYIHDAKRESSMMFVISVCALVAGVMDAVLKRALGPIAKTHARLAIELMNTRVVTDRADDSFSVSGPDIREECLFRCMSALGIEPEYLMSSHARSVRYLGGWAPDSGCYHKPALGCRITVLFPRSGRFHFLNLGKSVSSVWENLHP